MRTAAGLPLLIFVLTFSAYGAPKPHVVTIGKWATISWHPQNSDDAKGIALKIRPLYVDGRTREFTTGAAHDVTDRTLVVQRIYRVNDSLPQESGPPLWRWQPGGWLQVDRVSGRIQPILLPEFDAESSAVTWFREYAAYCGNSDDGQRMFAFIVQLGRRKPLLKKAVSDTGAKACPAPVWERSPVRAIFQARPDQQITFEVKIRATDQVANDDSDGEE